MNKILKVSMLVEVKEDGAEAVKKDFTHHIERVLDFDSYPEIVSVSSVTVS